MPELFFWPRDKTLFEIHANASLLGELVRKENAGLFAGSSDCQGLKLVE